MTGFWQKWRDFKLRSIRHEFEGPEGRILWRESRL